MGVKVSRNSRKKWFIRAKKAVISNASLWNTQKLLPQDSISQKWRQETDKTPMTGSFMHLHLGTVHLGYKQPFYKHPLIAANKFLFPNGRIA